MPQADRRELNWYRIAHQILVTCQDLTERVQYEGVTIYLTDTDLAIMRGFGLVLKGTTESELQALSQAAGLDRAALEALHKLYRFRKGCGASY
jgi:hypothetical protein